ncbi:hypothetical protein Dimus_024247 [Dionaea muscipula]
MSVIHLKKKDVVKSSVKGVVIEFDHDMLATILGVPGNNGICEYIKDVWEESRYIKPLEITRRFANDETLTVARRVNLWASSWLGFQAKDVFQASALLLDLPSKPRIYFQLLRCFLTWLLSQGCISSLWAASWLGFQAKDVFPAFGLLLGLASKTRKYFQPLANFLGWLPSQGYISNLWAASWLGF